MQNNLPTLQQELLSSMDELPSQQEIATAVFSLGSDRAAGPNDVNARFVQTFWSSLKPTIEHEVQQFFATAHMPTEMEKSNMVLISKTNMLLMRKILHSFSHNSFRQLTFCLKSNLTKAFDRMSWTFVEKTLTLHSLPPRFITWIMACVKSACFIIMFQGSRDGFITPIRGLRQGCALSPYLFILCMNILTSMLQNELQQGRLKGLRLARTTPVMTNLMHADDLLLLGSTDRREARCIKNILQTFCNLSGQRISPEKSKLWFSKNTTLAQVRGTMRIFQAKFADERETYLGSPVHDSQLAVFQSLLQKMDNK